MLKLFIEEEGAELKVLAAEANGTLMPPAWSRWVKLSVLITSRGSRLLTRACALFQGPPGLPSCYQVVGAAKRSAETLGFLVGRGSSVAAESSKPFKDDTFRPEFSATLPLGAVVEDTVHLTEEVAGKYTCFGCSAPTLGDAFLVESMNLREELEPGCDWQGGLLCVRGRGPQKRVSVCMYVCT